MTDREPYLLQAYSHSVLGYSEKVCIECSNAGSTATYDNFEIVQTDMGPNPCLAYDQVLGEPVISGRLNNTVTDRPQGQYSAVSYSPIFQGGLQKVYYVDVNILQLSGDSSEFFMGLVQDGFFRRWQRSQSNSVMLDYEPYGNTYFKVWKNDSKELSQFRLHNLKESSFIRMTFNL